MTKLICLCVGILCFIAIVGGCLVEQDAEWKAEQPAFTRPIWPSLTAEDNVPPTKLAKLGRMVGGTTSFALPWRDGHEDEVPAKPAEIIQWRDESVPSGAKHVVCVWDGKAGELVVGSRHVALPATSKVQYVVVPVVGGGVVRVVTSSRIPNALTRLRLTYYG